jgi:vacuolar-type H+-ATPase subunit D/Vma8
VFKAVDTADVPVDYTGLARGGQQVTKARNTFSKCVETLIQLATLQTSFLILDEVRTTMSALLSPAAPPPNPALKPQA